MAKRTVRKGHLSDAKLIEIATEFRKGLLNGRPSAGMCGAICFPLASLLSLHGVKLVAIESDLGQINHIWLQLKDGRALDPTADQFEWLFPRLKMPAVYLGEPRKIHKRPWTVLDPAWGPDP